MKKRSMFLFLLIPLMSQCAYAELPVKGWPNILRGVGHSFVQGRANSVISNIVRDVMRNLVAISIPGHNEGLVVGCLVKLGNGEVGVVTVRHGGGKVGAQRDIILYDELGKTRVVTGTVKYSGTVGFHNADFSFLPVPETFIKENNPLLLGELDPTKPIYMVGYRKGHFGPLDSFITQREVLKEEGMNFIGNRIMPGETPGNVINYTGACGSPLMQEGEDGYRLVGIHTGSVINSTENLAENRTFGLNISKAIEENLEIAQKAPEEAVKPLIFQKAHVADLAYSDRVKTIELVRNGEVILRQEMRDFPYPYSDAHSEMALGAEPLVKGDVVRYYILKDNRQIELVEHVIP